MSEVKVDTISERTAAGGVTIDGVLIKDSIVNTDNIAEKTAAAGVTIDGVLVKDGVATFQTAAGSPLVFEGATADAFETTFAITDPTADRTITFPDSSFTVPTSGGLSRSDTWFLNVDMTISDSGVKDITAWTRWNDSGYSGRLLGSIGDAFASPSSGKWTFPETGIWQIYVDIWFKPWNGYYNQTQTHVMATEDDGSNWYTTGTYISPYAANLEQGGGQMVSMPLSITDLSNDKVKITANRTNGGLAYSTFNGSATEPETSVTFVKIGD